MRSSRCFVLDNFARTARFLLRQNQSVQLRLICIYVCPTSAHRGFRYGCRRYKNNTFTSKTTLSDWQSMILSSKQFESSENLVNLLESRGLQICDRNKAIQYLDNIGYYRLKFLIQAGARFGTKSETLVLNDSRDSRDRLCSSTAPTLLRILILHPLRVDDQSLLEVGVSTRWTCPSSSLFFTFLLFVTMVSVETPPSSSRSLTCCFACFSRYFVLHLPYRVTFFPSYFPFFSCKITLNRHFFMHNSLFGGDDDGEGKMSQRAMKRYLD